MMTESGLLLALLSQHAAAYPEPPYDVSALIAAKRKEQAKRNLAEARRALATVIEVAP